jgi:hypothetical protein
MNHTLSNFSSELLQLQKTIKLQENTIVSLTNQYSQVQHKINQKLRKRRLGFPSRALHQNLGFTLYGPKFIQRHIQNQQHLLFISSFFLGVISVLFLVFIIMLVE